jgi:hypothetical protein
VRAALESDALAAERAATEQLAALYAAEEKRSGAMLRAARGGGKRQKTTACKANGSSSSCDACAAARCRESFEVSMRRLTWRAPDIERQLAHYDEAAVPALRKRG